MKRTGYVLVSKRSGFQLFWFSNKREAQRYADRTNKLYPHMPILHREVRPATEDEYHAWHMSYTAEELAAWQNLGEEK